MKEVGLKENNFSGATNLVNSRNGFELRQPDFRTQMPAKYIRSSAEIYSYKTFVFIYS
jgi:hypothetical protein